MDNLTSIIVRRLGRITDRISVIANDVAEIRARLGNIESRLRGHSTRLGRMDRKLTTLREEVQAMKDDHLEER